MSGPRVPVICGEGLSFFCAARPPGEVPEHRHAQLQILVLFEPTVCILSWRDAAGRSKKQEFRGPAVVMVAPMQRHACSWQTGGDIISLYLERPLHRKLLPDGPPAAVFAPALLVRDTIFWEFASALRRFCAERDPTDRMLVPSVARSVAIRTTELVGDAHDEAGRRLPNSALQKIGEYVETNLPHDIHADDLARCAGLSLQYFSALFKATTGITPANFILERRMRKAQELLRTGEYNIREVARAVGYWDAGHFTGKFRKYFGYAPRAVIQETRRESANRPTFSFVRP